MSHHFAQALDRLGQGRTWLHRRDARVKLLAGILFLLVLSSFPKHELPALSPCLLLPALWIALGEVPLRVLGRGLLFGLPFLVLLAAANPFLDRTPQPGPGGWILPGGWWSAGSIVGRGLLALTTVIALVATTPLTDLLRGAGRLGLPRVFTTQVFLLHRYLFVLAEEATTLRRAWSLRAGGRRPTLTEAGRLLAALLERAWARAERLHRAMLARGFTGELPTLNHHRLGLADAAFLAAALACGLTPRLLPLHQGLGHWLQGVGG